MSGVLIDNWTLQRAAVNSHDTVEGIDGPSIEGLRVSEALVLWDNIYYLENEYSDYWKETFKKLGCENCILPLDFENVDELIPDKLLNGYEQDVVSNGAIKYSIVGNIKGISYLPCEERAQFLKKQPKGIETFGRADVMKSFDKNLVEYYEKINAKLGTNKITYKFPALADYILAESKDVNYITTALQIRADKKVIAFREWLEEFEKKAQEGDILELDKLSKYLPAIIEDVTKLSKIGVMGDCQIVFNPTHHFPFDISIPLSIAKQNKKLFHISFLRELAHFSVRKRKFE